MFSLGYIITVTTESGVCPLFTTAFGAAIGYIGHIQLTFTVLIVYLLSIIGIARPLSDHATISNMLKGSGMAELAEEVEMSRPEEEQQQEREKYQILDKIPPTDHEIGQIDQLTRTYILHKILGEYLQY